MTTDSTAAPRRRLVFKDDLRREWGIRANDSTLWRWEKERKFPMHFACGNRNAWFSDEIDAHVSSLGETRATAVLR